MKAINARQKISSWGRLNAHFHDVVAFNDPAKIANQLAAHQPGIAYGMGRSYGDVCLNPDGVLWSTRSVDHFIQCDDNTGILTCEAGVLLRDIQRLFIPRGWMLPVTPGTQLVTVGGAVANDVHGKNHHVFGSFGNHVKQIKLMRTDGEVIVCGPDLKSDWFAATVGGLGLTGFILEVTLQLRRIPGPWLDAETIPYRSLEDFFEIMHQSETCWENTVSWVDCTMVSKSSHRGILMRANPTENHFNASYHAKKKPLTIPFSPPFSLMNTFFLKPFNQLYFYWNQRKAGRTMVHYEPFFYPLDNILEWNRLYGLKGLFQYQSVVPQNVGKDATKAMLQEIGQSGEGSFLSTLKTFGEIPSVGLLSFPQPGVTLALDFPNKGSQTLKLLDRLDAILREAGGRIYPAKDARMPRELFEKGYPRLNEFLKYRDPNMSSALSRRLMGS